MTPYILRRLALTVPVALVAGTMAFLLTRMAPGDPAAVMLGAEATPAEIARLRARLHLDDPLLAQYARWLGDLARLDFGDSIFLGGPVREAIAARIVPTLQLALYALALVIVIAIPAGVWAALHAGSRLDRLLMVAIAGSTAVSGFLLGILLILVFAVGLRWLPPGGYVELSVDPAAHFRAMALPTVALGLSLAGLPTRLVRAAMRDVLREDFIRTAMAKGLPQRTVARHALRNAMLPVLTSLGAIAADLLGGAVAVETVFGLPGMGQLAANSIARRDFPVIQGVVMAGAVVCLLANLMVDVLYAWSDPRIRRG